MIQRNAYPLVLALGVAVVLTGWAMGSEDYRTVAGWSSTVAIVLFVGGVQLTGLWLMGQYLARTYDQVKGRPCYIVADALGLECPTLPPEPNEPRVLPRRTEAKPQPAEAPQPVGAQS